MKKELFEEMEELLPDEDCPCCRMMREEWGMVDLVPLEAMRERGLELPDPASLDDDAISVHLWKMIAALAELRIFLEFTDHLSDRELYEALWKGMLRETVLTAPDDLYSACHFDMVGCQTEQQVEQWLRFHADDQARGWWQRDHPDSVLPPREPAPYRRDRILPRPSDVFESLQ